MKAKNFTCLLAWLVAGTVGFDAQAVEIRGVISCGMWAASRTANNSLPNELWLVAFLSGIAFNSEKDFLSGTDTFSITAWMDNYCKANPLDYVMKGASTLSKELIRRKGL